jgi:uncharacterized membrane protein
MSGGAGAEASTQRRLRRGYLDWMRGLAVLIMIEAHLLDSWTRFPDRESSAFVKAIILGGMGAPLFLFLAGVSVPLSAGSKLRKTGDAAAASRSVVRRGLEIFGLSLLFRVQAWILGWGPWRNLLKVDILNVMGPSIAAAAALWGAVRTTRARYAVFACAALATALLTPVVRATGWLAILPDPIEGYFRPVPGITSFAFFPWSAFVFAGAIVGLAIDSVRTPDEERRLNMTFVIAGAALAIAAYGASHLPSPYERSDFWTSSPAFFFLRLGLLVALVGVAYAWGLLPWGGRWSPLEQLGRTSLFIYWIHVELIYGLISLPLHRSLSLGQAGLAFALFSVLMLGCSVAKDRLVAAWRRRRAVAGCRSV